MADYTGPRGPSTPEWKFAVDQNFVPEENTFAENYGAVNGDEVFRLANVVDRICIYVRVTPEY